MARGQRQVLLLARALGRERDLSQTVITSRQSELERRLRSAGVSVESVPWSAGLDPRVILAAPSRHAVVTSARFSTPTTAMLSPLPHSVPAGPVRPSSQRAE